MEAVQTTGTRLFQKFGEVFNTTEKIPLDGNTEELIQEFEKRKKWADSLIELIENVVQPNPALRIEDMFLKGMDKKKERISAAEQLGDRMEQIGNFIKSNGSAGNAFIKFGQLQASIGQAERTMQQQIDSSYVEWLRDYVKNDYKVAKQERENLENARLDLGRAKSLQKHDRGHKKTEYDKQVADAQSKFNEQLQLTRDSLKKCIASFDNQAPEVEKMLQFQETYYQNCLNAIHSALS